jgi:concanavalin A-like lectin/glucanase superfamily protein
MSDLDSADTAMRDGLVAEYLFTGNADDTSGARRHGAVHGAELTADRFGEPHRAYQFDGADDYIEVDPAPSFPRDTMSVSAWARYDPRDFSGWTNCIVAQDDGRDVEGQPRRVFQLSTFFGHVVWHRMVGARDPMCRWRVRPGVWTHIVAVHDRGHNRLYVDGVLHDRVEHALRTDDTQPLHIGRKGTKERYFFFQGAIDDVRIYGRALSIEEVGALLGEGGWAPPGRAALAGDPLSGHWGQHGVVFLDLIYDGDRRVRGRIMAGRPDNMAAVETGTFDRETGTLKLAGRARHHETGAPVAWTIEGMLDEGELAVTAAFDGYSGNFVLTRDGTRIRTTGRSIRSHVGAWWFAAQKAIGLAGR